MKQLRNRDGLTEKEFLAQYQPGSYERPSVTVDMMVLMIEDCRDPHLKLLLIERGNHPFMKHWALPGGFVDVKESLEAAAARELKEETGLSGIYLEQLYTFGDPERDPRMRVISATYLAMLSGQDKPPRAGDDASDARWFELSFQQEEGKLTSFSLTDESGEIHMKYEITGKLCKNGVVGNRMIRTRAEKGSKAALAFDHARMIAMALERICGKCDYTPVLFNFMPKEFTMPQLQNVYELFLGKRPHNTLFRQKMEQYVEATERKDHTSNKPAQYYRYHQN